jgi:anti-sigma factor RsiW
MKRNPSNVHPNETILLAYLDAELPRPAMRSTAQHLQSCWKCRAALADLELQAQAAAKMLNHQGESDISRADAAKATFLERKSHFEAQKRRYVIRFAEITSFRHSQVARFGWAEQITLRTA